jgi:hypothetical protein
LAFVYFALYVVQLFVGVPFMPPISLSRPICTKYTGKLSFLTYQSNIIGCVYFGTNFLHKAGIVNANLFLVHGFPLAFALSVFLTLAYYGLDHFNSAQVERRKEFEEKGWPHFTTAAHLEHCFALPVAVFYTLTLADDIAEDIRQDGVSDLRYVAFFSSYYLIFMLLIKMATGEFVYNIYDEINAKHGLLGMFLFSVVLVALTIVLGYAGVCMV